MTNAGPQTPTPGEADELPRPVVALGASAGGLEAIREFLSHMPADSGMAFVVVQHLDPRHSGVGPDLLSSHTPMPVVHAQDEMPLSPNSVYVIPPNALLGIQAGRLRVKPITDGAQRSAINTFFRELAEDQTDNAVAVVLSGIGGDGALGLSSIKMHGGLTLAQSPDNARYDGMPKNAVMTGLVDHVLPVHSLPAKLMEYARGLRGLTDGLDGIDAAIEARLDELLALLNAQTGHDFAQYKKRTLTRRIQRRLQVEQLPSFADYFERLRADPEQCRLLVRDLLVGVTQFFRDPEVFEALRRQVLDRLAERSGPIRIWVPGCSTGEEAYTIAILLAEAFDVFGARGRAQIFATDLDERALDVARYGRYPAGIESVLGPERMRFFERDGSEWVVTGRLRELCVFSHHDLVRDPPFSRLDLISCRNLLIYLEPALQQRVLDLFHYALGERGHLLLGPSENVSARAELFGSVDKRQRLFVKKPALVQRSLSLRDPELGHSPRHASEPGRPALPAEHGLSRTLEAVLVEEFAPPTLVVNEQGDVVYVSGRTGKFIEPQSGMLTLNVVNLVVRSLRPDLRAALHSATRSREVVTHDNLVLETPTGPELISLIVRPLRELEQAGLYAIIFQEHGKLPETRPRQAADDDDRVIQQLESELKSTKAHLQTTIEELETSNEELKSSNEELLSMNEELQSLNEEFETLNIELKRKVEELDTLNSDLDNLLRSTQLPTLFLDAELKIRRFTPAAGDVFHIIDTDLGRPITDLAPRFDASALPSDARAVLYSLAPLERELSLENGSSYIMRTTPYRTLDNVIDGVVVTFVDLTKLKEAEIHKARLAAIVEGASEAIIAKTLDGLIISWNFGAECMYGYKAEEVVGKSIQTIVPPERAAELEQLMDKIRRGERIPRFETVRVRKDGARLDVAVIVSPLRDSSGALVGASAIASDISAEKRVERALRASEERYRSLVAASSAVVFISDPTGAFVVHEPTWERFTGQTPHEYRGWGWLDAIHPDDRRAVQEAWRTALAERSNCEIACRVFNISRRSYAYVVARTVPVFDDESGVAREWVGTLTDVTPEREALEASRTNAAELNALFENSAAGIVETDIDGRILRANRRFAELTGYELDEIIGMRFTEVTHPADHEDNQRFFQEALARGVPSYYAERQMLTKTGENFFAQLSAGILRDDDGQPTRVIAVLQDITQRKRIETELARAKLAAEQASRAKDQFLAVLSHELRTPLTPVLAAAVKLERTEELSEAGKSTVRMIQRNVELEARLIDDLLDLTRISRGRMELKLQVIDASAVMEQALDIVSLDLEAKGLAVDSVLEERCYVKGDAARLQQVFWNLLKNAVKFTPSGGTIRLRCRHDAERRVVAEVSDNGVGIPRNLLPHVFDAFEQGVRQREGLGLGLAISRALVELHGGEIFAESGGPGRGSTFRVMVPASAEPPTEAPPRRPSIPPELRKVGLSVLLVEDHVDSAQLMRELLELSGHRVEQACSIADAVQLSENDSFDLLISDLGLPDGSGLELVRLLRRGGKVRHAIALSGYGMEEDLRRSREAGFEEHLVKPVNPRELDATIQRVTRQQA